MEQRLNTGQCGTKGEPQQIVLQKIIDEYEKANPDITVDVLWMGQQVMSKIRNAALGGDAPDLTEQSEQRLRCINQK